MRKLLRSALASLLLSAAAGCQTPTRSNIPNYVAPQGSNTARVLFRGTPPPPGFAYGVYAFDDPHTCAKPLLIGAGSATKSPASSAVRAGPLATLQYFGVDPSRRICRVAVSFYPVAGRTYLFYSEQDASTCKVRVADATNGEKLQPVELYTRRMQGARCAPLAQVARPGGQSGGSFQGEAPSQRQESQPSGLDELKDLLPSN